MPIYEYECSDCGHQFEALVRSDTVPHCPGCASTHLEKQLSVFATTASAASAAQAMPSPCDSCGHPGGPGSCGMHAHA
jgi:putative FmdB family regulatory protein